MELFFLKEEAVCIETCNLYKGLKLRKAVAFQNGFTQTEQSENKQKTGKMRGSTAGLAEGFIEKRNNLHDAFLAFLDMAFASIIVTPTVVTHWRGTWNLTKMYLFPDDLLYSGIACISIGIIGQFIFTYCQDTLTDYVHPDKRRLTYMVVSRLYTLIFGLVGIMAWLGLWDILDIYCPSDIYTLAMLTFISTILLVICKGLRNVSSPPFGISTDNSKDYFTITTMFKSSVRYSMSKSHIQQQKNTNHKL